MLKEAAEGRKDEKEQTSINTVCLPPSCVNREKKQLGYMQAVLHRTYTSAKNTVRLPTSCVTRTPLGGNQTVLLEGIEITQLGANQAVLSA